MEHFTRFWGGLNYPQDSYARPMDPLVKVPSWFYTYSYQYEYILRRRYARDQ